MVRAMSDGRCGSSGASRVASSWRWPGSLALCALLAVGCHHSEVDAADTQNAEQIFGTVCARCHGADGEGGVAPVGGNAPRNFCDAAFQASRSDADLALVIHQGKGGMPAFGNLFSDGVVAGLVHKVRSFTPTKKGP
jgi:mono/diheme cytochrome c family protein